VIHMNKHTQRGGTFLGFIMGLVLGLGVALAVAIYVTKVPTPFSNKNQPRSSEQESAETQKNKDWNPNGVLQPKAPAVTPSAPATPESPAAEVSPPKVPEKSPEKAADKPAEKTADKTRSEPAKAESRPPAVSADPLGDLAKSKSGLSTPAGNSAAASDPFDYMVQVGAYRNNPDADAQKARLAMMGLDAKVSERDQAGRTVYRVRLGPFSDKAAAERVRQRLEGSGIENTLVRVQR
jgi:cell division protein FtsN